MVHNRSMRPAMAIAAASVVLALMAMVVLLSMNLLNTRRRT